MKFRLKQKGFSLVEVLVAIGIMGAASFYFMQSLNNSIQSIGYLEDKLSYLQVKGLIERYFSDHAVCANSLVGRTPVEDLPGLYGQAAVPILLKDEKREKIKIDRLFLTNPKSIAPSASGFIKLNLSISRLRTGGGPISFPTLLVDLPVFLDGTGKISRCAPYDLNGTQYILNPGQLYEYIGPTSSTSCFDIVGDSTVSFYFNSACSRWCQQSCTSTAGGHCKSVNAGPERPIIHHGGGFVSECNGGVTPHIVQCTCIN